MGYTETMSDSEPTEQKPRYSPTLVAALERARRRAAKIWEDLWHVDDIPGRRGFMISATSAAAAATAPVKLLAAAGGAMAEEYSAALLAEAWAENAARDAIIAEAAKSYAYYFGGTSSTIPTLGQAEAALRGQLESLLGLDNITGLPQTIEGGALRGKSYEQAAAIVEQILEQQSANIREAHKGFEIILKNPDKLPAIEREAAKMMGRSVNPVLQDIQRGLSTPEAIEGSINARIADNRFVLNREMVLRYGKPLPGTSAEELEQLERYNKQQLDKEIHQAIPATIEAHPFDTAGQDGEPPAHGFILNIGAPRAQDLKPDKPFDKERAFYDLCATVMTRYPKHDLLMTDTGKNTFTDEKSLAKGNINLIPMDTGLYVILPPQRQGERDSNLATLEALMQDFVEQTKAAKREALKAPAIMTRG